MVMKNLIFLAILLVMGCTTPTTGQSFTLDSEWRPLLEIRERSDEGRGPGYIETRGQYSYVNDLEDWLAHWYVPGTVEFHALMLHEREHSVRQGTGLSHLWWEFQYNWLPGVKWEEEKHGWRKELIHLLKNDAAPSQEHVVSILMDYDMASEKEIREWVSLVYEIYKER
jgi:hypothetical protein